MLNWLINLGEMPPVESRPARLVRRCGTLLVSAVSLGLGCVFLIGGANGLWREMTDGSLRSERVVVHFCVAALGATGLLAGARWMWLAMRQS